MVRRLLTAAAVAALSATTQNAAAQHAGFTLIGSPTQGVADMAPEERFVHPITDAYFHEDSFITNDVRVWASYQSFGGDLGIDNAKVYTAQLRLAIMNQLQFMVYKDGYTEFSDGFEDGWNDVGVALKWNFLQDWGNNLHASAGVGYEFPWGDNDLENDDEYRVWLSVNKGYGPLHLGGTVNFRHGDDTTPIGTVSTPTGPQPQAFPLAGDTQLFTFHLHADYYVNQYFSPVVELNAYVPVDSDFGEGFFNAGDLANFDSKEISVTLGIGAEVRPMKNLGIRAAYELPLSDEVDLYGWRATVSAVYSF